MVGTRKSIPSRASNAADDLVNLQDPKAQAILKALQIDAGEALGGAQLLGKRKQSDQVETYVYNGASYEVDNNTMQAWVKADRKRLAKKRKLEEGEPSASPAPSTETKIQAETQPPRNPSRKRRWDQSEDVVEEAAEVERPATIRKMRDTPCAQDEPAPFVTSREPEHQRLGRSHQPSTAEDEISYQPRTSASRRCRKGEVVGTPRECSSLRVQSQHHETRDNAADDIRNAREAARHAARGTEKDDSAVELAANIGEGPTQNTSAVQTAKAQRESAMELLLNLQKMSKANSQVRAILAKARALKTKYRDQLSAQHKIAAPTVISPPESREPSFTKADPTPEIPDSDPAVPAPTITALHNSPISAPSSTNRKTPDVDTTPPPTFKSGKPLHWNLNKDKLQDTDDAAGDIFRHKRQAETQQARRRRIRHEKAVVMGWELQEDTLS